MGLVWFIAGCVIARVLCLLTIWVYTMLNVGKVERRRREVLNRYHKMIDETCTRLRNTPCPKCKAPLEPTTLHGTPIFFCEPCQRFFTREMMG